jgi:hypothetical protein
MGDHLLRGPGRRSGSTLDRCLRYYTRGQGGTGCTYLLFLHIFMSISEAVGRRRALKSSQSGLPVIAPAPASYRLHVVVCGLGCAPVVLLPLIGDSGAVSWLIGLGIGIGLTVIGYAADRRARR